MLILRMLCRWFPRLRFFFVGIGYVLLMIGGLFWFICFPLAAFTLKTARQFPFEYFGIPFSLPFPMDFFLPKDMVPLVGGICVGFTLFGMVTIYFNVRNLRKLRLGQIDDAKLR